MGIFGKQYMQGAQFSCVYSGKKWQADLTKPIDLSLPLRHGANGPRAWYVEPLRIIPVRTDHFTGSVEEGGSVNFRDIFFNPHGHGTHTECVGHISPHAGHTLEQVSLPHFILAQLVSVRAEQRDGDRVIPLTNLKSQINTPVEALIIRTLPNDERKKTTNYSNTNPTYLEANAAKWFCEIGIQHLLIDLPSVDREEDGGALAAHKAFWNYPDHPRTDATITELIFVPDTVSDGTYLLNFQTAHFDNDATPSRPILFPLQTA